MTPDQLLARIFDRSDQLLWLWNAYAAVVFVVLAVAAFVPSIRTDRRLRLGLIFVFVFFAYSNLESMRWVLKQWAAVSGLLKPSVSDPELLAVIEAPHPLWVFPFHGVFDVFVVVAVTRLGRRPATA